MLADIMLLNEALLVPYITTGVVASAVVHSTTIWLQKKSMYRFSRDDRQS